MKTRLTKLQRQVLSALVPGPATRKTIAGAVGLTITNRTIDALWVRGLIGAELNAYWALTDEGRALLQAEAAR